MQLWAVGDDADPIENEYKYGGGGTSPTPSYIHAIHKGKEMGVMLVKAPNVGAVPVNLSSH